MSTDDITAIGKRHGLEFDSVASGGRYQLLMLAPGGDEKPVFVLENPENGEGPSDPNARIGIICYPNMDRWTDCVEAVFPNAEAALKQLASADFRTALVWEVAGLLNPGPTMEATLEAIAWSVEAQQVIKKQDFTFAEMANEILENSGAEIALIPHPGSQD